MFYISSFVCCLRRKRYQLHVYNEMFIVASSQCSYQLHEETTTEDSSTNCAVRNLRFGLQIVSEMYSPAVADPEFLRGGDANPR